MENIRNGSVNVGFVEDDVSSEEGVLSADDREVLKKMPSVPFTRYQIDPADNLTQGNNMDIGLVMSGEFSPTATNPYPASVTEEPLGTNMVIKNPHEKASARNISSSFFLSKRSITNYCTSQRGHELTVALSAMMVLVLIVVGLALLLSFVFGADSVTKPLIDNFFITLYSVSTVMILILLLLGALRLLTNDRHYRDQSETSFLRGGVLCLGTGGIVYHSIALISYSMVDEECEDPLGISVSSCAILFIVAQIAFVMKYSRVRINKTVWLSVSSRFLISLVVATNVCVWVNTVILESKEEVENNVDEDQGEDYFSLNHTRNWLLSGFKPYPAAPVHEVPMTMLEEAKSTSCDNCTHSKCHYPLKHIVKPYLWPLLIEYCVASSTLLIAVWEKCGHGLEVPGQNERHKSSLNSIDMGLMEMQTNKRVSSVASIPALSIGVSDGVRDLFEDKKRYYNSQYGFLLGWMMICLSSVLIIVYLYYINQGDPDDADSNMMLAIYSADMTLSAICLITVPITVFKMRSLTFRDAEIKKIKEERTAFTGTGQESGHKKAGNLQRAIDRQLLGFTNLSHMAFHVMTMIAAADNNNYIIFANGLISVVMACAQTIFINWYATQKRSTTEKDIASKPGRQCLEVLRCGNFALWLVNTFLVKHPGAKRIQNRTFGVTAWAVVSNLFQPLLILYHFHAVCCIAEVINHSYSLEYLGLIRPSKLAKHELKLRRKSYSEPNIHLIAQSNHRSFPDSDSGVWNGGLNVDETKM